MEEAQVVFKKVAPWDAHLVNSYRDRFVQVGDRKFKVSADDLYSKFWNVEELTEAVNGQWHGTVWSWQGYGWTLAGARTKILELLEQPAPGLFDVRAELAEALNG